MDTNLKFLSGFGKVESSPELEQADVSNEMGAGVGSSGTITINVRWQQDVGIPADTFSQICNIGSIGQDIEVTIQPYKSTVLGIVSVERKTTA